MKKILLLLAGAFLLNVPASVQAQTGGPDAFGYTWITSQAAGGPTYNWIDISARSGVQTVTGLADDNSAASMINVGFPFHYYWSDYSQLKVGSNGWLSFNNISNIASCFPTIPAAGGAADNYLAPLMGDLNFTGAGNTGQVKYWTNSVDTFIISYINVPFWTVNAPGWTGANNFQVILCSSDSSITYQYGSLSGFTPNAACTDITVGIENSTGAIGLQVHSDALPPTNYAIRFEAPNVPLISIQDLFPRWNSNVNNKGVIILNAVPYQLNSNIRNGGNADITVTSNLQASILDQASTNVFSAAGTLPSLAAGTDTLFAFSPAWTPAGTGLYTFETTTTCSQDINAANNTNRTEIMVVDGCSPSMNLSYVSGTTPDGSLNWNGGANDDGAAVYFAPPVYPYTVTTLQYYISSNAGNGFTAQIFADDGPNGTAGTLLFNTTVASGSIVSANWNTVAVNPGVTLNSGGFYVVWLQSGTTIFLGTQSAGPHSHQNFEILDGAWASYREDNIEELCIRASITNYSTAPLASFSTAFTSSLTYDFSNTSTGVVVTSAWDFGDGITSTLQDPTHTYATEGTYNVCLITASHCGHADTICQSVAVCAAPVIDGQPLAATVCEGTDTVFSVNANGTGISYQWQEDQGSGFTDLVNTSVYNGVNTLLLNITGATTGMSGYQYRCIVTGTCGADTSDAAAMVVNALTAASFTPVSPVCNYTPAFALSGGAPAGGTYSGTGVSAGNFDPATAGAGMYLITYTFVDANMCTDTAATFLTVHPSPVVTLDPFANVCVNDPAMTLSGGTPAGGTYSGTGVSSGTFDPALAGTGTYAISYIFTDTTTCQDTAIQSLTVDACVGITELSSVAGFSLYPNPATGSVTISTTATDATLYIYDALGKQLRMEKLDSSTHILSLRELNAGIYTFRLQSKDGNTLRKLVIEQ
ncbi:MAG: hypothetical protein K0S33_2848 [Bacteroidetes bacterium]|jgi:PKD repeat protein|nr:hypothetical protein [Bacteroidota bacterium]